MPRFFIESMPSAGQALKLPDDVARHVHVLRLTSGDSLTLFNGTGPAFSAVITEIGKKQVYVTVGDVLPEPGTESPYRIELVQGIASNEKMDWLIEKAVELGVHRIVPLIAERSVVRLSGERALRRHAHWQSLARAACEQCGRNAVPEVAVPMNFREWLRMRRLNEPRAGAGAGAGASAGTRLLLSPRAAQRFADLPDRPPAQGVSLLIGPEGGWSDDEEAEAIEAAYTSISLGPRILRTETAGMALLAALAGRWGGW